MGQRLLGLTDAACFHTISENQKTNKSKNHGLKSNT